MFQDAGDIKSSVIHTSEIKQCLSGLGLDLTTSVYDRSFSVTTLDNWMDVIANDIMHKIKYIKELKIVITSPSPLLFLLLCYMD